MPVLARPKAPSFLFKSRVLNRVHLNQVFMEPNVYNDMEEYEENMARDTEKSTGKHQTKGKKAYGKYVYQYNKPSPQEDSSQLSQHKHDLYPLAKRIRAPDIKPNHNSVSVYDQKWKKGTKVGPKSLKLFSSIQKHN